MTAPGAPGSGAKPVRLLTSMTRVILTATGALSLRLPWPSTCNARQRCRCSPGPGGRLSNVFLASIRAAAGAPAPWIGLTAEGAAIGAGALNVALMYDAAGHRHHRALRLSLCVHRGPPGQRRGGAGLRGATRWQAKVSPPEASPAAGRPGHYIG